MATRQAHPGELRQAKRPTTIATFEAECPWCGDSIPAGADITKVSKYGGWLHAACAESLVTVEAAA